jgi:hypothetical protein
LFFYQGGAVVKRSSSPETQNIPENSAVSAEDHQPLNEKSAAAPAKVRGKRRWVFFLALAVLIALLQGGIWAYRTGQLDAFLPPRFSNGDTGVAKRMNEVEQHVAALSLSTMTALEPRLSALEKSVAELRAEVEQVRTMPRSEAMSASTPVPDPALNAMVDELSKRLGALEEQKSQPDDRLKRDIRYVGAQLLSSAFMRGEPLSVHVGFLKRYGGMPDQISALEIYAQSGAPTRAQLTQEFLAVQRATAGFFSLDAWQRLWVRVRASFGWGVDASSSSAAQLHAIARLVSALDFSGALKQLEMLPERERLPYAAWMVRVSEWLKADQIVRDLGLEASSS